MNKRYDGHTLLQWIAIGDVPVLHLLSKQQQDAIKQKTLQSGLRTAMTYESEQVFTELLQNPQIDCNKCYYNYDGDHHDDTPLTWAIKHDINIEAWPSLLKNSKTTINTAD